MAVSRPAGFPGAGSSTSPVTVDCYDDDEELGASLHAFEEEFELPMDASVVGVPIEFVAMEYGGDVRRGVVHCRREGEDYQVSLADVALAEPASASALHAAFRRWLGCEPARLPPGR